jgi:hypothetical protein
MSGPLNLSSFSIKDVDTSMPCPVGGAAILNISNAEVGENKAQTGYNLMVEFALAEERESTTGGVISPGFKLRKYYPLQQSQSEKAPDFRRDIAVLYKAVYGPDSPDFDPETVSQLIGHQVEATLKVVNSEQYGEQAEIRNLKHML